MSEETKPKTKRASKGLQFGTIEELKELIIWAKSQKVLVLQVGEVQVQFSAMAFVDDVADLSASPSGTAPTKDISASPSAVNLPSGNAQPTEDDEDRYWSSRI